MAKHKYISLEAAIDAVDVCNLHRGIIDALQAIISDIPSADVVEVVRCKDCIHAPLPKSDYGKEIKWPKIELIFDDTTCPYYCEDSYYSRRPLPDWFCCHGERREDDAEDEEGL